MGGTLSVVVVGSIKVEVAVAALVGLGMSDKVDEGSGEVETVPSPVIVTLTSSS